MAGAWRGSDRPLFKDLHKHVVKVAPYMWRDLGIELLPYQHHEVLNIIEADYPHDSARCCQRVLQRWLETTTDATWNRVISALRSPRVELNDLACHLEQMIIRETAGSGVIPVKGEIQNILVEGAVIIEQILDKNEMPKMKDLNRYVTMKYAADWYNIGIELGLEYGILNRIERNHSQSITCFRKTLQEWLKLNNNDATWRTLEVVLTNVNRVKVGLDPVNSVYGGDIDASGDVLHVKSSTDSISIVTESLICPVCYQLYKNPKYLSCHHSYCEGCIEQMQQVESKIICPECRAESAVPVGGVKDLPADFRINSMMDKLGIKHRKGDEVLKCNECVKDEPVVAYCQMCSSYLCEICCEYHQRSKRYRGHKTVTVAKLRSNKHVNIHPKALSLTCKDHHIDLLFYCETCKELICEHCVVKSHYGHSYAKATIQACKCQIDLEAITPVKMVVEDLSDVHVTIDEIKKKNKQDALPTKENAAGAAFVMHVDGPHQISCDGESGGYYVWNDCGLEINFPPKCSQEHIQVSMNIFLPIENEVYPGIHIVSAVCQFDCNIKRFDKAFTLRLQHCVKLQSPEDCQKFRFIVMQDDNNDVKYGNFEAGKSYGTIALDKFCRIFIIWISEPWKNIRIIVIPLSSDQDDSSQQVPSSRSSNSGSQAYSVELSGSSTDHRGSSPSASGQQHDSSQSVPPNSNTSPAYNYEAMIGLPRDHHQLNDWSGFYSIYINYGTWRKVCKESIQMEEVIRNHAINFYAGEIDFDANGTAEVACEQSPEAVLDVECTPYQITKRDVIKKYEDYVEKCRMHPLFGRRENFLHTIVHKLRIDVTNLSDTQPSNCQLVIKGIEPQQKVDLCKEDQYSNLTLIGTVDPQSTQPSNTGPVSAGPGLKASDIHIDISPRLKQSQILYEKPKVKDLLVMGVVSRLAAKWETVAYLLEYDTPKIDNIKTSKRENPEKCCQEMLRDWVEDKPDDATKTWFTLLNTIAEDETFTRSIEKILEKLEKKYAS